MYVCMYINKYTHMNVTTNEKRTTNLRVSKMGYMRDLGERKGNGKSCHYMMFSKKIKIKKERNMKCCILHIVDAFLTF